MQSVQKRKHCISNRNRGTGVKLSRCIQDDVSDGCDIFLWACWLAGPCFKSEREICCLKLRQQYQHHDEACTLQWLSGGSYPLTDTNIVKELAQGFWKQNTQKVHFGSGWPCCSSSTTSKGVDYTRCRRCRKSEFALEIQRYIQVYLRFHFLLKKILFTFVFAFLQLILLQLFFTLLSNEAAQVTI